MLNQGFYISIAEIRSETKDCMRGSWKAASATTFIFAIFMLVLIAAAVVPSIFVAWWFSIPFGVLTIFMFGIFHYGYTEFSLHLARQESPSPKLLFSGFSRKLGQILKVETKRIILLLMWLVIFVVPFFVKAAAYSMATLLMVDRGEKSATALKESKHIMTLNYGRYFKYIFSNFFWFLLVLISGGIALIWVAPKFAVGKAIFYENLKTEF